MSKEENINKLIAVSDKDMALVENNMLTPNQLAFLFKKTPEGHISTRPAKGGGQWKYVTGTYVKKVLNLIFGWMWSFEVVEHKFDLQIKQAYVLGKLTVKSNGQEIVKMQFGRVDIKFKKNTEIPLDLGNDLKAATTDALKKCASELGIASDVYAPNEFKEIYIKSPEGKTEESLEEVCEIFAQVSEQIKPEDAIAIERIIKEKEKASYSKAIKILKSYSK
mgnify:CR=1 FL=1